MGQISYSGNIGNKPIELVTNIYLNKDGDALYALRETNDPFVLQALVIDGTLNLSRKNKAGNVLEDFKISHFNEKDKTLIGTYTNYQTKQELPVTLTKQFELETGESVE